MHVRFDASVNWIHEREWRSSDNIAFDPVKSVVLVPDFDSVLIFSDALSRAGISVKGILPLLDICAWT
jgi:hypothetical protein